MGRHTCKVARPSPSAWGVGPSENSGERQRACDRARLELAGLAKIGVILDQFCPGRVPTTPDGSRPTSTPVGSYLKRKLHTKGLGRQDLDQRIAIFDGKV